MTDKQTCAERAAAAFHKRITVVYPGLTGAMAHADGLAVTAKEAFAAYAPLLKRCKSQLATLGRSSSPYGIGPRTQAIIDAIDTELGAGKEQSDG